MSTTAPLTFGQLSVLRSLESVPREELPLHHQVRLWRVPAGASRETVHAALRQLAVRHEGLRTRFTADGQIVHPGAGPDPEPAADDWTTHADALRRMGELGRQQFDLAREYGWRARPLLDADGFPRYVAVSMHHVLVDRYAFDRITHEFSALVRESARITTEHPLSPRRLAEQQHGEQWATRRQRAMEYLRGIIDATAGSSSAVSGGRVEARRLATPSAARLAAASAAMGVSPQAAMLALSALVVARLRDTGRPVFGLMASNRLTPEWQGIVSSMNQRTWVALDVTAETDFVALAKRAALAGLTAFRHGCYDVDELARLVETHGPLPAVDCSLNVMTQEPGVNTPETPAPDGDTWVRPRMHEGAPFDLKVFQGPQTRTDLRIDPRLATPAELLGVLDWFDAQLGRLAAGERPRVAELRDSLSHWGSG
ncbi:condensation domain-containing protein [Kutzneria sp. NPDC052558]|uniref:condensation domain-containing protein n=1 Tax=Kutzneria sp. NPDC052558 TaxID=3364121 RepID=UPI0037C4FCE4